MQNSTDHIDEPLLVKALSKGNILAFNTLFKKYGKHLYSFALSHLKSTAISEELVQEVFTKVWDRRKELKDDLSFKSYIFTIAFNLVRKHFRTKAYLDEFFKMELNDERDMQTIQKINYDSLLQYLKELVKKMPEKRKTIFIKSRFEGQTIKEIASELKISHKTVENQLTSGLKFIRENLKKEYLALLFCYYLFII